MVGIRCKEIICELKAMADILSEDDASALEKSPDAQANAMNAIDSLRRLIRDLGERE